MTEYVFYPYPRWIEGADGPVVVHDVREDAGARGLVLSDEALAALQERVGALSDAINAQHHTMRPKAADEARSAFDSLFAGEPEETPRRRGRPPKVRE